MFSGTRSLMTRALGLIALVNSLAAAQGYLISTFAGGAPPPTPIAALQMTIYPQGIAADSSGNLYFISSNCVFKLDKSGIVTRVAGNSRQGYSGDGGPALVAEFQFASGLAADAAGNLYVADTGNYRVRKISTAGIVSTVAGSGVQGFSGDGGAATNAQLGGVTNVAADSQGNLFLVDGSRIRKISASGIISTVAGNGSSGFSGDGGPAIGAQLNSPSAVAADGADNLYISDDANLRVRRVSADGIIATIAGTGMWGISGDGGPATMAQLTGASGLALDKAGNLYVASSARFSDDFIGIDDCSCVRKVSPAGIITTVPISGVLIESTWLTIDSGGNLFVASYSTIYEVASGGAVTTAVGNGGTLYASGGGTAVGFSGDGHPASTAQFYWPVGVTVDSAGNTYVADTFNNRVRVISPAGIITTVAGNGAQGFAGDGGPAANAQVYLPTAVAVDSKGNIFIADHGNGRIRKVSAVGNVITTVAGNGASIPAGNVWGLAIDNADNLYVPDTNNHVIRKISPNGVAAVAAGNGVQGFSGDGGLATSAQLLLSGNTGLTTDGAGNLYFVDDNLQPPPPGTTAQVSTPRIRRVSTAGIITTFAGNGTAGSSGDGGPATSAQLNNASPIAIAADRAGNLYLTDAGGRIRMVSQAGVIGTIAGAGGAGYSGDGGPALNAQLNVPAGVAADSAGNLYVADEFNNDIRLLQPVSSGITIAGVTNAASGLTGAVSPGEIVVISGSGLGPAQLVSGGPDSSGVYADLLAETTVQFNGAAAPLIYTWATQVAAVVPYSVTTGPAQVTVAYQGRISASFAAPVSGSAPGLFTLDSTGKGQAVVLNADGSVNSAANPAKAGDTITVFATGEGETTPVGVDGQVAPSSPPQPILPVSLLIGGKTAAPIFAGGAPGEIAGMMRIEVAIPAGIPSGSAVPIVVQVGSNTSQRGVTVAIQ
jgi:uncharacterized protein (TIGR03437 family)